MDDLLKGVGLLVLAIVFTFYQLFVFTKVWLYVAVPMGAPEIGLLHAYGLDLLLGIFRPAQNSPKRDTKELVVSLLYKTASITIVWALAYWIFA